MGRDTYSGRRCLDGQRAARLAYPSLSLVNTFCLENLMEADFIKGRCKLETSSSSSSVTEPLPLAGKGGTLHATVVEARYSAQANKLAGRMRQNEAELPEMPQRDYTYLVLPAT